MSLAVTTASTSLDAQRPRRDTPHARPARLFLQCVGASVLLMSLGGCALLSPGKGDGATPYAPDPRVVAEPSWPSVRWYPSCCRMTPPAKHWPIPWRRW